MSKQGPELATAITDPRRLARPNKDFGLCGSFANGGTAMISTTSEARNA
jgi:hypothetical protein